MMKCAILQCERKKIISKIKKRIIRIAQIDWRQKKNNSSSLYVLQFPIN